MRATAETFAGYCVIFVVLACYYGVIFLAGVGFILMLDWIWETIW